MLLNRERALATMEKHGVDALVATTAENIYYLSDYYTEHLYHFAPGGFAGALLPRDPDQPAVLVIQEWELPQLTEKPSWMPEIRVGQSAAPARSDPPGTGTGPSARCIR
jgi:Xaa-Pro aminopeptidase